MCRSAMKPGLEWSGRRRRRAFEGIQVRHRTRCSSRGGGVCSCSPSYQAQVWSVRDRKPIRRTFGSLAEARAWRQESQVAVRRLTMRAPTSITVREAAEAWLSAAEAGLVRTRSGSPYKPSALRSYREGLRTKLLPELGHLRLSAVSRNGVQDLVDRLVGEGFAPSSVRNAICPGGVVCRSASMARPSSSISSSGIPKPRRLCSAPICSPNSPRHPFPARLQRRQRQETPGADPGDWLGRLSARVAQGALTFSAGASGEVVAGVILHFLGLQ